MTSSPPRLATHLPRPYVVAHIKGPGGAVHRAGPLTHYLAEDILDDARRARVGDRLELTLSERAAGPDLERMLERVRTAVRRRGVEVIVHLDA